LDVVRVTRDHAAEILRPRAVDAAVNDHVAYMPRAQFMRIGRVREKRVDLALRKQVEWLDLGIRDPMDVLHRVEPDLGRHQGHQLL
jgi:hypothetical protein